MNVKNWPVLKPVIALLFSRKFLVVAIAAAASLGLDLEPEVQALVFTIGAGVIAVTTAWEDYGVKRSGGG
jgi:hypothetical protein